MKWLILGAGRSGFGAQKLLQKHGFESYIFDENPAQIAPHLRHHVLADQNHSFFFDKDLRIVLSPGFALDHPVLVRARAMNHTILTEIDLALSYFNGCLITVSGTNGKSTTVMMIGHLLTKLGYDHAVGGNIGIAASSLMLERPRNYLVLELSSYQIEASKLLQPYIAVLTGLSPDHLLRHKTLKGYLAAKWHMFAKQSATDFAIIEESSFKQAMAFGLPKPQAQLTLVTDKDVQAIAAYLKFRWQHDQLNGLLALHAVSHLSGRSLEDLAPFLDTYQGLPYRCELIGKIGEWSIINDSKGTNMDSTIHALSNVRGRTILFLGGQGKGESFKEIQKFAKKIGKIIAFGAAGPQVFEELSPHFQISIFSTLKDAVSDFATIPKDIEGDILFSPACASQDEFSDFENRGHFFTSSIHLFLKENNVGLSYEPVPKFEKS